MSKRTTERQSNIRRIVREPEHAELVKLQPAVAEPMGLDPTDDYQPYRDTVRTLIRDGMPSTATNPYGIVRQESLSDQIQAQATPTGTVFMVRWQNIPLGRNVTVQAVPATIAAYVDGNPSPKTVGNAGVTADIDINGNFTLATAPASSLLVTYGWQVFSDDDVNQLLENARSWLQVVSDITMVPDGLIPALVDQAAAQACESIGRAMSLPDVTAGEAKEALSAVAKSYLQSAKDFYARADKARSDYFTTGDALKQPQASVTSLAYPAYQPIR